MNFPTKPAAPVISLERKRHANRVLDVFDKLAAADKREKSEQRAAVERKARKQW